MSVTEQNKRTRRVSTFHPKNTLHCQQYKLANMSSKDDRKESSDKERRPRRKLKREAEGSASMPASDKKSKVEVKQKPEIKAKNLVSEYVRAHSHCAIFSDCDCDFVFCSPCAT